MECLLQFPGVRTPQVLGEPPALAAQTRPGWLGSSNQPERWPTCPLPSVASLAWQTGRWQSCLGAHATPTALSLAPTLVSTRGCGELGWCYSHHKPQSVTNCPVVSSEHIYNWWNGGWGECSLLRCLVNKTLGPWVGARMLEREQGDRKKGAQLPPRVPARPHLSAFVLLFNLFWKF